MDNSISCILLPWKLTFLSPEVDVSEVRLLALQIPGKVPTGHSEGSGRIRRFKVTEICTEENASS